MKFSMGNLIESSQLGLAGRILGNRSSRGSEDRQNREGKPRLGLARYYHEYFIQHLKPFPGSPPARTNQCSQLIEKYEHVKKEASSDRRILIPHYSTNTVVIGSHVR